LVNSFLDFLCFEVGCVELWFELVELDCYIVELVGMFLIVMELVRFIFIIDCELFVVFVWVDCD